MTVTLFDAPYAYPAEWRCKHCWEMYRGEEVRIATYVRNGRIKETCRLCVLEQRRKRNSEEVDRLLHKARTATIREYEKKYRHLAPNVTEFAKEYGWWPYKRVADDIAAALAHACCYCAEPFTSMSDCTLDIFDPLRPPYYGVNTRWCCNNCNQAKNNMDPHDFAIWQALWRRRRRDS